MASKMSTDDSVILYSSGSKKPRGEDVSAEFKPYEQLPFPYQALDSEGKYLHINPPWLSLFGYERQEVIGKFFGEFLTAESLALFEVNLDKFRDCGAISDLELVMKHKDGAFIFIVFDAAINRDARGNFRQVDCFIEDVTAKKKVDATLKHRLRMEEIISSASSRFIDVKVQDTDATITDTLKEIGTFVQADRTYLTILSPDGDVVEQYFEWHCHECTTLKERIMGMSMKPLQWIMGKLRHDEHLHVPSVKDLPDEAKAEREIWQEHGVHSVLVIPLREEGILKGYLGFNAENPGKTWTNEDTRLLKVFGEIFIDYLSRLAEQKEVKAQGERLKTTSTDLEKTKTDLKHVTDERTRLAAELEKARTDLKHTGEEKNARETELHKTHGELTHMTDERNKLGGELERTREDLKHTTNEKATATAELAKTKSELTKTQEERGRLQADLEQTRDELKRTTEEKTTSGSELGETRTELQKTREERGILATELDKTKTELAKTQETLKKAQEERPKLEGDLKAMTDEREKEHSQLTKTRDYLANATADRDRLHTTLEKEKTENQRLQAENAGLTAELTKAKDDVKRLTQRKERLYLEIDRMKTEVKKWQPKGEEQPKPQAAHPKQEDDKTQEQPVEDQQPKQEAEKVQEQPAAKQQTLTEIHESTQTDQQN